MTKSQAIKLLQQRLDLTNKNFIAQINAGTLIRKAKITERVNFYKGYITALAETNIITIDEFTDLIEDINALEMYWNERRLEQL